MRLGLHPGLDAAVAMQQSMAAVLTGLVLLRQAQGVAVRGADGGKNLRVPPASEAVQHGRTNYGASSSSCPGLKYPCSGKGECNEHTGVCWCRTGYGSSDCSTEISETYDVKSVSNPAMEDMIGRYTRVPMYLQENAGDPRNIKFIHYDPISEGWSISRLNSSCTDDICFFAYSKGQSVPPPKGYVYGQPDKHVYYKQLVFDDKELYPNRDAGYHMSVSYTPDPNAVGVSDVLGEFTGRYILQPRWVHKKSGKYAIMPVSLSSPGKLWAMIGLEGTGPGRKYKIIAQTQDPSLNRYTVPSGGWSPPESSFQLVESCADHVSYSVCESLEDHCRGDSQDTYWVQACCRDTCNSCAVPSAKCTLPNSEKGASMLLQMLSNRTK